MKQYITNTGRTILTSLDLSYAADLAGIVQTEKLHKPDLAKINDCPTQEWAQLLSLAQKYLPKRTDFAKACQHPKTALKETAISAALANERCLALQEGGKHSAFIPHPYIYDTDNHRFALTEKPLYYALAPSDPSTVQECKLLQEDLNAICFISKRSIATFLAKYSCSHFCAPEEPINVYHNPSNISANRIQVRQRGKDPEYVIRDGNQQLLLPDILASETNTEIRITRMYLSAAEYQLALCNLYLAASACS